MVNVLQDYVKYTAKELESYVTTEGSCVFKINKNLHISIGAYSLADFKHALVTHLVRKKVGYYDVHLNGIVLDIKKIKVLGTTVALRADDPALHVNLNADCYVFRPVKGAVLSGVVKHIGNHHFGVIIYRVFNANIRVSRKLSREDAKMDEELQFRIKNFNLQNVFPYIEGELLSDLSKNTIIKFEREVSESATDSGIEERELIELDDLVTTIKKEELSEPEDVTETASLNKRHSKKNKRKSSDSQSEATPLAVKVKSESKKELSKKRKSKSSSVTS